MIFFLLIFLAIYLWLIPSMFRYLFKSVRRRDGSSAYVEDPGAGKTASLALRGALLFVLFYVTLMASEHLMYGETYALPATSILFLLLVCFFPLMVRAYRLWRLKHPKKERYPEERQAAKPTLLAHVAGFFAKTGVLIGLFLACLFINILIERIFRVELGSIPRVILFTYVIVFPFRKFRAWFNRKYGLAKIEYTVDTVPTVNTVPTVPKPREPAEDEDELRARIEQNVMAAERHRMTRL